MRPLHNRRTLTELERAEWASFARHLKPLPGRDIPTLPVPPASPNASPGAPPAPAAPPPPPPPLPGVTAISQPLAVGATPGGLDRASWRRLRTGRLVPERRLDLHGLTVQRAHGMLLTFLHQAHAEHVRCVEIITGRGSGEGGGALRRELPFWLNLPALRPIVLAAVHPHPQNPGAVRLLLRRAR